MKVLIYVYISITVLHIVLSLKVISTDKRRLRHRSNVIDNNNVINFDRHMSSNNNINFVQNEGPVIRFTIPKYNVRVHIVGCIHGSPTSKSYVEKVMNEVNPNAVVLELCQKRYLSLKEDKDIIDNQIVETNHATEVLNINRVGFLVYCLSILTYSQRSLKIIPGGEFIAAMREAERRNISIVMGDEEVEKIICSLKSVGDIKSFIFKPLSILETLKSMAFSITGNHQFVEFGKSKDYDIKNSPWLNILPAFFRETNLVRDTLLLMSPSIIPILLVSTIANYVLENYESFPFSTYLMSSVDNATTDYLYQIGDIVANMFTFYWALVVVNIFRYVIIERDQIIANRIKNACEQISKEEEKFDGKLTKDIVCVLGMLHCNGVAKYLLDEN